MIEIREMPDIEIQEVLRRVGYGHLGCSENDRPYVVPIHYVYDGRFIYIYTNEGLKTEILRSNPQVCLQVEEVVNNGNWMSVVVNGIAEQVTDASEIEKVTDLLTSRIPTPTPAMGITWVNNWISAKKEKVFRILPETFSGRSADKVDIAAAAAQPASARKPRVF